MASGTKTRMRFAFNIPGEVTLDLSAPERDAVQRLLDADGGIDGSNFDDLPNRVREAIEAAGYTTAQVDEQVEISGG